MASLKELQDNSCGDELLEDYAEDYGEGDAFLSKASEVSDFDSPDKQQKSVFHFTKTQKWTLLGLSVATMVDLLANSILAPFFPREANKMGMSDAIIGLIFGCFSLTMFIMSPIFGKFISQIGCKVMFLAGSFLCGVCAIIYGFLNNLDSRPVFVASCFIVRSVEAVGAAASTTASGAIVAKVFPNNTTLTLGILEAFGALGLMLGPPLGGYLYQAGGFFLPFTVLGGMAVLVTFFNFCILPNVKDEGAPKSGSIIQLLKIPSVIVTSISVITGSMALGVLDPLLTKHLTPFRLNSANVGSVFMAMAGPYAVSEQHLLLAGSQINGELWIVILSLVIIGMGVACSLVPTFTDIVESARWYGMEQHMGTYGVVSGVYRALESIGGFIGPTAGGALEQAYGFSWAACIMALIYLMVSFILIVFCIWEYQCGRGRRKSDKRPSVILLVNSAESKTENGDL
uniref:MFS-type transporter SLC18B1-like n=1 Tax=Saccoglossus kowalevskii TaxID=10224 RepID=A0ABM0MK25_SACKO|nr:PREDICTED: MFS-type transporter SLC18B1-like [Saccoglossus kowalevskii]